MADRPKDNPYGKFLKVSLKPDEFNKLIAAQGVYVRHEKVSKCPHLTNKQSNHGDIVCDLCDNGYIAYESKDVWVYFYEKKIEQLFQVQGIWELGDSLISFPGSYEDGLPVRVDFYDRITLLDFSERVSDLVEKPTPIAITFINTDVNIGNDTITLTKHKYILGQSGVLTNSGGTVPGGLTAGSTYYVIPIDENTVKLALSYQNASDGVFIDLTSAGSGTNSFLPTSLDMDRIRYEVIDVTYLRTKNTIYYKDIDFEIYQTNVRWKGANRPANGEIYTLAYDYLPVYRVINFFHENRYYYNDYKSTVRTPTYLPIQAQVRRDYIRDDRKGYD